MKKVFLIPLMFIFTGCANQQTTMNIDEINDDTQVITQLNNNDRVVSPDIYQYQTTNQAEVIRRGRYTLVSISPEEGQKYLLEQLVSIKLPRKKYYTVAQGMRKTLKQTGLLLCQNDTPHIQTLYSRSLPKVHYKFGQIKLREALQMLAGPAYDLTLDNVTRTVCFQLRSREAVNVVEHKYEVVTESVKEEIIEE
ncbi:PilL N-terminal domain-containing protein [Phocoenobacter skyensis]|uniref:PFGI-1 class ICE element type IV pilus protein PilL2 n=1 Tax=Phocoenobacter skyensis TaxID=97481 RepID=UPI00276338EB|nr:PilL N-terminal domain-containing protein [Pasteurella skyensis]MDP8185308.1 PilL N-terminal domain-containing protein [Pasteurella skyensis]